MGKRRSGKQKPPPKELEGLYAWLHTPEAAKALEKIERDGERLAERNRDMEYRGFRGWVADRKPMAF